MDFLLGGLASVGATMFTNPLDVLKIRLQLQGELQKRGKHAVHYRNFIHGSYVIAKTDGLLALQKGIIPALMTQFILNGTRFGLVQYCFNQGYTADKDKHLIFYKDAIVSSFGGTIGAILANPFFLVKTQIQAQAASNIAVGHQHHHRGSWSAMKTIISESGLMGLFRGVEASIIRVALGSPAQLTTFAFTKDWMLRHKFLEDSPILLAFFASIIGGLSLCLTISPLDLISVRLYNQGVDANGKGLLYDGIFDCVIKIWKTEGFLGFYKGLMPNFVRLGPHTVLCLIFWEQLKQLQEKFS